MSQAFGKAGLPGALDDQAAVHGLRSCFAPFSLGLQSSLQPVKWNPGHQPFQAIKGTEDRPGSEGRKGI